MLALTSPRYFSYLLNIPGIESDEYLVLILQSMFRISPVTEHQDTWAVPYKTSMCNWSLHLPLQSS
jgi:hypothetical protein